MPPIAAIALMTALDGAQRKNALLGYQVRNLVLGPGEDGKVIQPEGVRVSTFTPAQREMLLVTPQSWKMVLSRGFAPRASAFAERRAELITP